MEGFTDVFSEPFNLTFTNPLTLSFLFTILGIILGFIFYGISYLKKDFKIKIIFGFTGFVIIVLFFTFLILGPLAYVELIKFILKITFILFLYSIPIIGIYGILNDKKNVILGVGGGILIFFFVSELLLSQLSLVTDQIYFLILFFILIILFIELGTNMLFFKESFDKISLNKKIGDNNIILRFNSVINKYLIYVSVVLIISYFFTLFIYFYNMNISFDFVSFELGSNFETWFFLGIVIISLFALWYIIPSGKKE